jgi:hypothetical protein
MVSFNSFSMVKKKVFANNAIYTEIFGPRSDLKLSTI